MWTKTAVHLDATDTRPEGWHYAQIWKDGGGPIGFCAEHAPHRTEVEARECYSAYLRSQLRCESYGSWQGCEADDGQSLCGRPTKQGFKVKSHHGVALCGMHHTLVWARAMLHLDEPAGDSVGS